MTGPAPTHHPDRAARTRRTDELVRELATCDEDRHDLLLDELVSVNMPVAETIARRYRSRGIPTEDLVAVAYLALTKAARRYDARSGHAFLSFCVPTVTGEVRRHFRDHGWMVRPPRRIQELRLRVSQAQSELTAALGRPGTVEELSVELGEPVSELRDALDVQGAFSPASLDRPVADSGASSSLGDLLPSEDGAQSAAEARLALAPVVRRLGDRDRLLLGLRFHEQLTQSQIAERVGITQMQVSRQLSRIFRDLRRDLGSLDDVRATASRSPAPGRRAGG